MKPSKHGNFYKTTVEITFKGEKVRVSKSVADAIAKGEKAKTTKKTK